MKRILFALVMLLSFATTWALPPGEENNPPTRTQQEVTYNGTATEIPIAMPMDAFHVYAYESLTDEQYAALDGKFIFRSQGNNIQSDTYPQATAPDVPANFNEKNVAPTSAGWVRAWIVQGKGNGNAEKNRRWGVVFKVNKRTLKIDLLELHKTYGNPDPVLTFDGANGSLPIGEWALIDGWAPGDEGNVTITGIAFSRLDTGEDAYDAAGNRLKYGYSLEKTTLAASNGLYNVLVGQSSFMLIDKAPLEIEVKPDEKEYRTADPTAYTWKLAKNANNQISTPLRRNDTEEALLNYAGETLEMTISRQKGELPGEYSFIATTPNYEVTVVNPFTIKAIAAPENITIANGTYAGAEVRPDRSITDKNGYSLIEGTEAEVAAGTADYWSGFDNNINATTATSKAKWTINYGPGYGSGTATKEFEIAKANMHITAMMKLNKTYQTGYVFDEADVDIDFTDTDFKGSDADIKDALFSTDNNYVKPKVEKQGNGPTEFDLVFVPNEGTTDVYGNSTNYNFIPSATNGKLVLGRAPLRIWAEGTKVYGDTKPEVLEIKIKGGDAEWSKEDAANFVSNYSITASRKAGENVGSYETTTTGPTVIGAAGSGYSVTFIPGEFKITKANLKVYAISDTKQVGEDDPSLWKIEAEGLVNGDKVEDIQTATQYYTSNNYTYGWDWRFVEREHTTATRQVRTYRVYRDNGETIGEYDVTRIAPLDAADYNKTLQNYNVTWEVKDGAILTITGIPVTVKVADATITYGQTYTPNIQFVAPANYSNGAKNAILTAIRDAKDTDGKPILQYVNVPEKPLVTESPYTITVKDGKPAVVLDMFAITYQPGTLTVNPFVLNVKANDQGIAFYGDEYCPWDVTINGTDYKTVEGYETGDSKIIGTNDPLNKVLKLELKDENVTVGATPNAYVLNKDFELSANYTINALVDDETNGWLTKETIKYIPLENSELAELLGVDPDAYGTQPSLLQTVLNAHRGKTVDVKMPARRMDAKQWYTWVLPFAVNPEDIFAKDAWGYGALEIMDEAKTKGNKIVFSLQMDEIPANTPFIAKLKNGIEAEDMNKVIIKNVLIEERDYLEDPTSVGKADGEGNVTKFVGLYYDKQGFTADQRFNAYANGEPDRAFWAGGSNSGNVVVKRTNAYLQYANENQSATARIFIQEEDGSLTAIQGVETNVENNVEGVYNLNGMKIQGAPAQKGVYIQNGKKVVIK